MSGYVPNDAVINPGNVEDGEEAIIKTTQTVLDHIQFANLIKHYQNTIPQFDALYLKYEHDKKESSCPTHSKRVSFHSMLDINVWTFVNSTREGNVL